MEKIKVTSNTLDKAYETAKMASNGMNPVKVEINVYYEEYKSNK